MWKSWFLLFLFSIIYLSSLTTLTKILYFFLQLITKISSCELSRPQKGKNILKIQFLSPMLILKLIKLVSIVISNINDIREPIYASLKISWLTDTSSLNFANVTPIINT